MKMLLCAAFAVAALTMPSAASETKTSDAKSFKVAQSGRTCTTTCSGPPNNRTCTRSCY